MAEQRKSEYIQVKVTPQLKSQVQKYCDDTGRTISSWVTWLIQKELEKAAEK